MQARLSGLWHLPGPKALMRQRLFPFDWFPGFTITGLLITLSLGMPHEVISSGSHHALTVIIDLSSRQHNFPQSRVDKLPGRESPERSGVRGHRH
jgi:hypothetical protein